MRGGTSGGPCALGGAIRCAPDRATLPICRKFDMLASAPVPLTLRRLADRLQSDGYRVRLFTRSRAIHGVQVFRAELAGPYWIVQLGEKWGISFGHNRVVILQYDAEIEALTALVERAHEVAFEDLLQSMPGCQATNDKDWRFQEEQYETLYWRDRGWTALPTQTHRQIWDAVHKSFGFPSHTFEVPSPGIRVDVNFAFSLGEADALAFSCRVRELILDGFRQSSQSEIYALGWQHPGFVVRLPHVTTSDGADWAVDVPPAKDSTAFLGQDLREGWLFHIGGSAGVFGDELVRNVRERFLSLCERQGGGV